MDPSLCPNPSTFNNRRLLTLREEPGEEDKHQFVTTNQKHIGFGFEFHACPGRFFASSELKILLVQLLMKYDWQFGDGRRW
jgi:cytochrome P450